MKLEIFLLLIGIATCLGIDPSLKNEWESYKNTHRKSYSAIEELKRYESL